MLGLIKTTKSPEGVERMNKMEKLGIHFSENYDYRYIADPSGSEKELDVIKTSKRDNLTLIEVSRVSTKLVKNENNEAEIMTCPASEYFITESKRGRDVILFSSIFEKEALKHFNNPNQIKKEMDELFANLS